MYLIFSISPGEELEVITSLRTTLDLTQAVATAAIMSQRRTQSRIRRPSQADRRDIDVIVLDSIRSSIMTNQKIGDAWFKSIDSAMEYKPLDILVSVLFITCVNSGLEHLLKVGTAHHGCFVIPNVLVVMG